jgi:hypothetical protein
MKTTAIDHRKILTALSDMKLHKAASIWLVFAVISFSDSIFIILPCGEPLTAESGSLFGRDSIGGTFDAGNRLVVDLAQMSYNIFECGKN